jgi:hypothetical protein
MSFAVHRYGPILAQTAGERAGKAERIPRAMAGARTRTRALGVCVLLLVGCTAGAIRGQTVDPRKVATIKAAYVFHMLQLTRWPTTGGVTEDPVRLLFVGRDAEPVAEALAPNIRPIRIQGRPVAIEQVPLPVAPVGDPDALAQLLADACFVYLGADAASWLPLLAAVHSPDCPLVAGDGPDITRHGGMVGFFVDDQRVRIRVNLDRVQEAGLRMSAEFIQHVEVVSDRGGE